MARKNSSQIWLEYAVARGLLTFLGALPQKAAIWLGITTGRAAFHLLGKFRRIGMRNLELAFPEKSEAERRDILKAAFRNLGRVLGTVSGFNNLTPENITGLIDYHPDSNPADREIVKQFEQVNAERRGRIILGGHIGNWELAAFSFSIFIEPLNFIARRMDNPLIEEMVLKLRTRLGNKQIDKTSSALSILRILRGGGTVGVLADINAHPKEGVFVPFFDVPACTTSGIAMLAVRANAVIMPMFMIWDDEKAKYFGVHEGPIEPVNTGDRNSDVVATTALCSAAIERVIRAYPEQWIWIHRRWKTRPPGEGEIY